ncbi:hypothetical protein ACN47E_006021 [Coniothyrium glycines]
MRYLLPIVLLPACAVAQLTTTAWYIGNNPDPEANLPLTGSVAGFDGSHTTVVLDWNTNSSRTRSYPPETVTLGDTYAALSVSILDFQSQPKTLSLQCSRADTNINAPATCTFSTIGASASLLNDCGKYSRSEISTQVYVISRSARSNRPAYDYTETDILDYRSSAPSYCTGSTVPESEFLDTATYPGGNDEEHIMTTYQLVLTAGVEKLTATATPSASPARSSASMAGQTQTSSTAGAIPMRTAAPAIAGMGAAIAAFFL